ncbi:hypothetical protein J6590_023058 [Homalodisca vitripennis]|nr:hypothetical protein J6590_023058 [Homalodisca vitripennis]
MELLTHINNRVKSLLLERVFLRIGAADTDEQLEQCLNKFLPPVLLKLSSQQEEVRKKVMELLTHINKRVKSRPLVQLPVEALLVQYQDPAASVFLTNFTIIYIKMGFPRLPAQRQGELIVSLLNSLESKPQAHQESLLLLVVQALQHVQWPSDPAKRQSMFYLSEKPTVKKLLIQTLLDVLLMPYGWATMPPVPPGLSEYTYKKILTDLGSSQSADYLEQLKLGIIKFLSNDALSDGETLCPLIVGAADARFAVTNAAELQLRKIMGGIEWENATVLSPLFAVYMGSKEGTPDKHKEPASTRLRLKLLPYICKARKQAILWPISVRVLFDSLYGENTHVKLKAQALTFFSVIIQQVSASQLSVVANVLLTSGLMKLIAESDNEPSLKQQAYLTAGQLVTKVPALVKKDLSLLQTLFTVLCQEENNEVRMSVREALLTMASAFSVDSADQSLLLALLTTQVESPSPAARLVAVRYLATVFPHTHALSRVYLLIATGDSQEEISNEALKSLYGAGYKISSEGKSDSVSEMKFPDFVEMVTNILEKAKTREQNINTRLIIKNQKLAYNLTAYTQVVTYLSLCLAEHCGVKTHCQRLQHPCNSTHKIRQYLTELHGSHKELLTGYIQFIFKLAKADIGVVPLSCLLECVGSIPDLLGANFVPELPWFKKLLSDSREDLRDVVAQLYGAVVGFSGSPVEVELGRLAGQLSAETKDLESLHGHILAVGYTVERTIVCQGKHINSQLYEAPVRTIVTFLEHPHTMIVGAASTAIAEVARVVPLPLPDSRTDNLQSPGVLDIVKRLLDNITSTKLTSKVKERSCRAAGMLCLTANFSFRQEIIDFFLSNVKEIKDVEIQLSVGEALVCCVLGPFSSLSQDLWTGVATVSMGSYDPEPVCEALLQRLLRDILPNPHPHARQSCCMWMLAVLKHCGHLTALKQHLMDLQRGFMDLLSENNDIVQDVASKGLALVYESGDADSRSSLVNVLVDQLTVGRRSVTQVTKDTKLFEEGTLGKAPTGGNLSTYQELCSLASDLNQPDLIYKFMHLANHNAIWNSKKGAAFGFSTIAKAAGEQLTAHLPKILPRLYRYQFDPTPKIQQSMASIWQALVPETNKTGYSGNSSVVEHNLAKVGVASSNLVSRSK